MPQIIGNITQCKQAIVERLQYSFGFNYAEARMELHFLLATPTILNTEEHYCIRVKRKGSSKLLNRGQRMEIHKAVKAVVLEHNSFN